MADRLHPLGQLRKDLTYTQVYDWFNCMEIGPCHGWMTSNSTLRQITTKNAKQLSNVLKVVQSTICLVCNDKHPNLSSG